MVSRRKSSRDADLSHADWRDGRARLSLVSTTVTGMKTRLVLALVLICGIATPSGVRASDVAPWRNDPPARELPFPRGERAQSVWASGPCWSECGSYCAWNEAGCLSRDIQGRCLKLTDACDRYCQRQCRTQGGP